MTDTIDQLDEHEPEVEVDESRRHIRDREHATYAIEQARSHRRAIADNEALYRNHTARIDLEQARIDADRATADAWLAEVNAPHEHEIRFREGQLADWFSKQVVDTPRKGRTEKLPGADLVYKPGSPSLKDEDVEAFAAWAFEHGHRDWVNVTEPEPVKSIDKVAVKKKITDGTYGIDEDGRIVDGIGNEGVLPGVRIVYGDDTIDVKFGAAL